MAEQASRAGRRLVPIFLCVALVGVPLYLLASEVRVMLSVDGRREAVVTRASTVEGLLSARDVEVDPHDHVKPGLTSGLRDGLEVQVLRARPIQLDVNGNITTVWSTKTTVSGIMDELDLKADLVKPARSARLASGATLVLRDAHAVTVVHDGGTDSVVTTAGTVRQLLEHMKVAVGPVDEVTPGLDTAPVAASTITITRVVTEKITRETAVPFPTQKREDSAMRAGSSKTIQQGKTGLQRTTYEVVRHDGSVVSKRASAVEIVRQAVPRIIVVGTRAPQSASGGASWYDTRSMTCAHRTLPFGTQLRVTNIASGKSVTCRVADRGPYVKGRVVDLSRDAFSRISPTSKGVVQVTIEW